MKENCSEKCSGETCSKKKFVHFTHLKEVNFLQETLLSVLINGDKDAKPTGFDTSIPF